MLKMLRYKLRMGSFRKPFGIFSIFLTTVAIGYLGYQFLDVSLQKNNDSGLLDSERTQVIQPIDQAIFTGAASQGTDSTPDDELQRKEKQEVIVTSHNLVISGTVVSDFGEVIAEETVTFYSPSQKVHYSMPSSINGEFLFADVKPAMDYVVTVSPRGMYKRYRRSSINLSFDQVTHNIVLEALPVGMLTGTVVDLYHRPVKGIELSMQAVEKEYWSTTVVTDVSGAFAVADFPAGKFQVSFGRQQSFRATGLNFDPDGSGSISLTVDLGPYSLSGRIYDQSGQTLDGASVVVTWAVQRNGVSSRSTRQVSADSTGAFRFTGLGPGDHQLMVSAWNEGTFKQSVKQTVNLGVDSGEVDIILNTL